MKEFINNIFKISNERLKNPLIYSFIISWIVINWKPIVTLIFSQKNIEERVTYISTNFSDNKETIYYPLLISLGYILVLPYFMWLIEYLVSWALSGRKENLFNEKVFDLKGKQKIVEEERKIEDSRAGKNTISELNTRIESLTMINSEKEKELNSLKIDFNNLKKEKNQLEQYVTMESSDETEYSEEEKKILNNEYEEFIRTEVSTYFDKIGTEISQFKSIPNDTEPIIVQKLIYSGLIKKIEDNENQKVYYVLSKKGKFFWKQYVLSKSIITLEEREKQDELPF
tara:strand:+ start:13669 stop:14523 length:855 start_codon:yes stop_codon:yes gene_type:complete